MSKTRLALVTIGSVLLVLILYWMSGPAARAPSEASDAQHARLEPAVKPGALSSEPDASMRRSDSTESSPEDAPARVQSAVLCQAVRAAGGRTPLQGAAVMVQLDPPNAIEPFASSNSDSRGVALVEIPLLRKCTVLGHFEGINARMELPEMSEADYRRLFPDGIEFDFFFDPALVTYSVTGGHVMRGQALFLAIGTRLLERVTMPRDGDLTDLVRPPDEGSAASGSFSIQSGAEVFWALYDQFGFRLLQGRSGRTLAPGDKFHIPIDLDGVRAPNLRYFQVVSGVELFTGPFMSNLAFQVFGDSGDYFGSAQGDIAEDGAFSLILPDAAMLKLVLLHPRVAAEVLLIGEQDGLSAENPIRIAANAPTRVFLRKTEYPEILAGMKMTVVLKDGKWRQGAVIEADGRTDELELIGGWSRATHSFRLGDRVFVVELQDEPEVRLPCSQVREIALPTVLDCAVEVRVAAMLEQTVSLTFMIRDEVWQIHRVYSPQSRRFSFTTRLPDEPGSVIVREGFKSPMTIPYAVSEGGHVKIDWINN